MLNPFNASGILRALRDMADCTAHLLMSTITFPVSFGEETLPTSASLNAIIMSYQDCTLP